MFGPSHTQSYRMHLKSTNGPIDVLVCPEGDERPQSPCSAAGGEHLALSATSTPVKTVPRVQSEGFHHQEDLDVSLSSAADVTGEEFEELIQSYNCEDLEREIDSSTLLASDMYSFESLSPPLQDEDFCFGLDATEGIGELFDLVS